MISEGAREPLRAANDLGADLVAVRMLTEDDWRLLRRLRLDALLESPHALLGDPEMESEFAEGHWRSEIRCHSYVVAQAGRESIGFARLNCNPGAGEDVHIESMWVHPRRRKQGVGRKLVNALEGIASDRGAKSISLWVIVRDDSAKGFYGSLGYHGPVRCQKLKVLDGLELEEEFSKLLH